jgi:hypothetical protein
MTRMAIMGKGLAAYLLKSPAIILQQSLKCYLLAGSTPTTAEIIKYNESKTKSANHRWKAFSILCIFPSKTVAQNPGDAISSTIQILNGSVRISTTNLWWCLAHAKQNFRDIAWNTRIEENECPCRKLSW